MSETPATGAKLDAIELLTSDHRTVEQLFSQLEAAAADTDVARHAAEEIIRELSVHAVIEEQVLYPAAREALGSEQLVDHSLEEHQEVKDLLAQVDGKPVDDPQTQQTFARVKAAVEEHVAEEEGKLFPQLRQNLGGERLYQLGEAMEKAKKMAPTRPHPRAPNEPPGNVIAGMPVAVLDKVRDALRSGR